MQQLGIPPEHFCMFALHEAIGIPQGQWISENILAQFGIPRNKDIEHCIKIFCNSYCSGKFPHWEIPNEIITLWNGTNLSMFLNTNIQQCHHSTQSYRKLANLFSF